LLARLMLQLTLKTAAIASTVPVQDPRAVIHSSKTQNQRVMRRQLEMEFLQARRINPFSRGGAFIPKQTGEVTVASQRWLPRFERLELELRTVLKRLPGYSRLCVCRRCDKFFIRKTARHRDYCSRKCAGNVSAQTTMERKRAVKRAADLRRVRTALKSCPHDRDPKEWAALKARVSKNWIAYAVARGEVKLWPRITNRRTSVYNI
jgi:hypothetical protein